MKSGCHPSVGVPVYDVPLVESVTFNTDLQRACFKKCALGSWGFMHEVDYVSHLFGLFLGVGLCD